jgi:hypothetical protein
VQRLGLGNRRTDRIVYRDSFRCMSGSVRRGLWAILKFVDYQGLMYNVLYSVLYTTPKLSKTSSGYRDEGGREKKKKKETCLSLLRCHVWKYHENDVVCTATAMEKKNREIGIKRHELEPYQV